MVRGVSISLNFQKWVPPGLKSSLALQWQARAAERRRHKNYKTFIHAAKLVDSWNPAKLASMPYRSSSEDEDLTSDEENASEQEVKHIKFPWFM